MRRLRFPSQFAFQTAAGLLSPGGKRASLLVLIYHRVLPQADALLPDEPDAQRFATDMDLVASLFNVLPLSEAVRRLQAGSLPARALSITFDDGYANNLEVAAPILLARKLSATVFVSTGFTGSGRMWNDTLIEIVRAAADHLDLTKFELGTYSLDTPMARRAAIDALIDKLKYLEPTARLLRVNEIASHVGCELPNDLMMDEAQLRKLHQQGIELGAHTINHPILARVDDERARQEILGSKQRLEEITGAPVTAFAYPNGRPHRDYAARDVQLARQCGFGCAVSTAWGAARGTSDPLQIPRVAPWDRTPLRFAMRLIKAYLDPTAAAV